MVALMSVVSGSVRPDGAGQREEGGKQEHMATGAPLRSMPDHGAGFFPAASSSEERYVVDCAGGWGGQWRERSCDACGIPSFFKGGQGVGMSRCE